MISRRLAGARLHGPRRRLLWSLFKRSYLDARRSETLLLTDRELIVDRVGPDGEREQHRLDAYWLRVEL